MLEFTRTPAPTATAARIVVLGSALLSAAYYSSWVWQAGYVPSLAASALLTGAVGLVAASLDSLKPRFVMHAIAAWRSGYRLASLGPAGLALLLALVSMWAIDGMLLKLRFDGTGTAASTIAIYDRTAKTLAHAEDALARLGASRSAKEVTAAMDNVAIDAAVLRRTNQCAPDQISRDESRRACEPMLRLREELAKARRREELEQIAGTARGWLDANPRPVSADPQLEVWSRILGLSEKHIGLILAMIVGFALELVALFGPGILDRESDAKAAAPAPPSAKDVEPVASNDLGANIAACNSDERPKSQAIAAARRRSGTASRQRVNGNLRPRCASPSNRAKPADRKGARLIALLRTKRGVSIADMMQATGWQAHSVRGFLSGTVRKKHALELSAISGRDGVRRYRVNGN